MSNDWKPREILNFINLFSQHECLWNTQKVECNIHAKRKNAWLKLSSELNRPIEELKRKMHGLRSVYVAEKNKVEQSRRTSATPDLEYQSSLYYYDEMKFLDSIIVPRRHRIIENGLIEEEVDSRECDEPVQENGHPELCIEYVEATPPFSPQAQSPLYSQSPDRSYAQVIEANKKESPPVSPTRPSKRKHQSISQALPNANHVKEVSKEENIYTAFGKVVSMQLSQLRPAEATIAMSEIHQILTRKVLQMMKRRAAAAKNARNAEKRSRQM